MNSLILTTKQIEAIYFEDSERFTITEQDEWVSQGKFGTKEFVFEDTHTGIHYRGCVSRSGSYYSDWTYESEYNNQKETLLPVEEKPVTRVEWETVDSNMVDGSVDLTEGDI